MFKIIYLMLHQLIKLQIQLHIMILKLQKKNRNDQVYQLNLKDNLYSNNFILMNNFKI